MYNHKKFHVLAFLCATAMLVGMTGCKDDNKEAVTSEEDYSYNFEDADSDSEELEYGATLKTLSVDDTTIEFDKRYLTDDEATVVAAYFAAISARDDATVDDITPSFYMNYLYENTYSGLMNTETYVATEYKDYQEEFSGDEDDTSASITIPNVEITDVQSGDDVESLTYLQEMFNSIEGDTFWDTYVTDAFAVCYNLYLTDGTCTRITSDATVYVVVIDGDCYICP